MKTKIYAYHFDTTDPAQKAGYVALCDMMKARGTECFETWGGNSHYMPDLDGKTIELETKHLFNNQWNTAPIEGDTAATGRRVFDWAQDYPINTRKTTKKGHYLDITSEMRDVRHNTLACGYCGHQERDTPAGAPSFCPECIGSEYLKAGEIYLLRMKRVDDQTDRATLTDDERAILLPRYKHAQLHGHTERDKKRIAKARADVIAKADRETKNAKAERDGFLWFMDRGIRTDNLIFYDHTGRFCFGWRQPVDDELRSAVLDVVSEFPFPYDLKLADGRTLSGG